MKVALCQLNTTVGAFNLNLDRICEFLTQAATEKAELAVFPELCISSYPPLDLLDRADFIRANSEAVDELQRRIAKIPNAPSTIILGSIIPNSEKHGRFIQNAVLVFQDGKRKFSQSKRLLPTYDVFDEARYFQPGVSSQLTATSFGNLGLSVCEDAWFDDTHAGRQIYSKDPAADLKGADLVVNVSASPFEMNKHRRREELLAGFVKRIGAPLIYVNQVGANDEILFDGSSMIYSASGEVIFEMPSFREGLAVVELDIKGGGKVGAVTAFAYSNDGSSRWEKMFSELEKKKTPQDELELLHKGLVTGIRDYFRKTGFKRAVIGLSGGIDSAVVACLAAEALGPRNVLGVAMPSQYSSSHSLGDAEALARAVGMEFTVHSIKFIFSALSMEIKPSFGGLPVDSTEENMQARLRGVILMALANKRNSLLLTTGNKSELAVGYCTTYGDMAGALGPIGDVYKTKVYQLAKLINTRYKWIPESTIKKAPSAELRPNQTDQDSLPPYDLLDRLLESHIENSNGQDQLIEAGFNAEIVKKILHLVRTSEFKRRQAAPTLKVTSKAFGLGRRIPVAKAY